MYPPRPQTRPPPPEDSPPPEEFDSRNDETFGDGATFDEDWEEQHEQLAAMLPGTSSGNQLPKNPDLPGWSPFSMDGLINCIKPAVASGMQSKPPFPLGVIKPNSGDSLPLPPFNKKPMTLEELERQILADNNNTKTNVHTNVSTPTTARPVHTERHASHHNFNRNTYFNSNRTNNYNRNSHYNSRNTNSSTDEYAGLMTQSNKEWLIRIQASALNFQNPYKEDFYFVSYKTKQMTDAAKSRNTGSSSTPSLIIPERKTDESSKVEYIPVQFEGSLGKIQVANVKCPRKLLDVDFKQPTKVDEAALEKPQTSIGRAELNAFRRLLLDIEQLYVVMLDIDEEDKKMGALPEAHRKPHADRRTELCDELFHGIYDEKAGTINQKVASIRKGIALIIRSLQVLTDKKQKAALAKSLRDPKNSHFLTNYPDIESSLLIKQFNSGLVINE